MEEECEQHLKWVFSISLNLIRWSIWGTILLASLFHLCVLTQRPALYALLGLVQLPNYWHVLPALSKAGTRVTQWRRQWHPTQVLLAGKSHGRRSLVGCSPRGRWGSDTTERLHFHFSLSCVGEGIGNPLQCSCLENPRDVGSLVGCRLWGCTESNTTEAT